MDAQSGANGAGRSHLHRATDGLPDLPGAIALRNRQRRAACMTYRLLTTRTVWSCTTAVLLAVLAGCGDKRTPQMDTGQAADTSAAIAAADSDTVAMPPDTTDSLVVVDTVPSGRLMPPWGVLADSVDAQKSWFVLRVRSGVTEMIPTKLALVDTVGACGAAGSGGRAANPLAINGNWIVMIADVPGLRAGAIDTGTISAEPRSADVHADSIAFSFRGERFVLRSERVGETGFRILHEGKTGRTTLYSTDVHDEGRWLPRWIGDLNRDGAPDIILEATHKYSVQNWSLHMSGPLQPSSAWRPAATYTQAGC